MLVFTIEPKAMEDPVTMDEFEKALAGCKAYEESDDIQLGEVPELGEGVFVMTIGEENGDDLQITLRAHREGKES